jgi:beta-N-acetylhexosaminidase
MLGVSEVLQDRTFSQDAKGIIELAGAFIKGMKSQGMPATLKHFPGHGGVEADSHHALPIDHRSMEEMAADLTIFKALMDQGAEAIMPAHVIYDAVDAQPAGFSKKWLQEICRQQMSFNGIVFSDDITMKATESFGDYAQRTRLALEAGCDFVLACQHRQGAIEACEAVSNMTLCEDSARRRQAFVSTLLAARD